MRTWPPMASSDRNRALAAAAGLGGAALLSALSLYLPYRTAFRSPRRGQNEILRLPEGEQYAQREDELLGLVRKLAAEPFRWVTVLSEDGLRLWGKLYMRGGRDAPVDLCFHGYRATGVRDFGGGGMFLLEQGHNVLLVDQRAQGRSQGHAMTFGVMERRDCLSWLRFIRSVPELQGPVTLYGVSMGAATVLLASALDLGEQVKCVVADSPYSTPEAILKKVSRDMGLPPGPAAALLKGGAAVFGGFRFTGVSCVEAARRSRVPILLIHGEEDRFVPCAMSREIAAAAPEKVTLLTFPGAGHGLSFTADPERYKQAVTDFCRRARGE